MSNHDGPWTAAGTAVVLFLIAGVLCGVKLLWYAAVAYVAGKAAGIP